MFNYTVQKQRPAATPTGEHWFRANWGEQLYDAPYFVCCDGLLESLATEFGALTNARKAVDWYTGMKCRCRRDVFRFTGFALIHVATFDNFHLFGGESC